MGRKTRVDQSPEEKWQIVQEGIKSGSVSETSQYRPSSCFRTSTTSGARTMATNVKSMGAMGVRSPTWTKLFDPTSVNACEISCVACGNGEPFTLGSFTGTAPSTVNNVLTPGAGANGTVGYIAQFTLVDPETGHPTPYQYYAFGASTGEMAMSLKKLPNAEA